ncbi:hypothetical protein HU200_064852 [Digitaria exilis]|uniref:Uncharacterized protein n=1 Tax=Digitaria exilis TaxID=1010633 RepID=A0A834ZYZ5_9POAL|nr:hypothetical protein HU200_064852 [Digitaria exilis]
MRCSNSKLLIAPAAATTATAAFRFGDRDMEEEDACEAAAVAALRGPRRQGLVVRDSVDAGGGGGGGGWVSVCTASKATGTTMSSGSSSPMSSFFSSTSSGLTDQEDEEDADDGATCRSRPDRDVSSSSLSSLTSTGSETVQMGGAAGPLDALSTMLEDLPALRTGLSKHYQGRSQSFTSLADVSCVEDLAKKTTPYIRRKKAPRRYAEVLGATNRLSKTIAKKAPRGKPPAYQGKREMYRC